MREWNLDPKGIHYYSQNNNAIKPSIRCKPTATVCGLEIVGHPLPQGPYTQPEDNLTAYMEETLGPDSPEEWPAIEIALNSHFFPKTQPVHGPRWDWAMREALFGITRGIPFIASTWLTRAGHVVAIIGYTTDDDKAPASWDQIKMEQVREIIIHDPYGDRTSGVYDKTKTGKGNRYPASYFVANLWRGIGIQIKR